MKKGNEETALHSVCTISNSSGSNIIYFPQLSAPKREPGLHVLRAWVFLYSETCFLFFWDLSLSVWAIHIHVSRRGSELYDYVKGLGRKLDWPLRVLRGLNITQVWPRGDQGTCIHLHFSLSQCWKNENTSEERAGQNHTDLGRLDHGPQGRG